MKQVFQPKLFSTLKKGYSKKTFTQDLLSGVIVGVVALPLAIAFAVASGVSPEKGLITAVIAGFIISFLGGSRVQIGGPTGAFIVIVYGILEQYGFDGLLISTILAGIFLVAFGLLKLGTLLKYIPHPLIVGFTSGIAVVIFSTQIKDALGLDIDKVPSDFIEKWKIYALSIKTVNPYAIGITIVTILISIFSNRITRRVPGSLIAIIFITVIVHITNIPVTTIESIFGEIPRNFTMHMPSFEFSNLYFYITPAITIALLGGIESLLSAVVADGMLGTKHRSNTELIAQGIANIVTPFFGGIPATGAIARTATNINNGGKTPISGIIHSITLLCIMLFIGQWAKLIPMSCLAGILIVVAYNMSEWRSFVSIFKHSKSDIFILLTTFFLTVFVDLSVAIQVGVVLSSLLFMKRMSDVSDKIETSVDKDVLENYSDVPKEIGIYEISGPFFFGTAKQYSNLIRTNGTKFKIFIIRMRHVPFIDATGIQNLQAVVSDLQSSGITIIISGIQKDVYKELKNSEIISLIGKQHILGSFDEALEIAKKDLNNLHTPNI